MYSFFFFFSIVDFPCCVSFWWTAKRFSFTYTCIWAYHLAQLVKNLPAMQEMQVRSLSQEESSQVAMTTISSIPARRIPWRVKLSRLQSIVLQRIKREWHDWARACTHTYTYSFTNSLPIYVIIECWAKLCGFVVGPCWLSILNIVVCIC